MISVFLFVISILSQPTLDDCDCMGINNVDTEFKESELVVKAKIIKKSIVGLLVTMDEAKAEQLLHEIDTSNKEISSDYKRFLTEGRISQVEVLVEESYKGELIGDTITVYTLPNEASCGFNFIEGGKYLIYAHDKTSMYRFDALKGDIPKNLEKTSTYWTNLCSRTTYHLDEDINCLKRLVKKH